MLNHVLRLALAGVGAISLAACTTPHATGTTGKQTAADPKLAAFGDEENAILEAQMFLAEYLASADPEVVARFSLPEGTRLHRTPVVVPRDDLPRRWNVETPIEIASLVIPTGLA